MKDSKKIIIVLSIILVVSIFLNIIQLLYIKQIESDVITLEHRYEELLEELK